MCADWTPLRWSHSVNRYSHAAVTVHNHCTYRVVVYCYYICLFISFFIFISLTAIGFPQGVSG
jgi:hypothetical protein